MENQKKSKKVIDIVVNVILWLFVAFSIFVTIVAVSAGDNAKNVPTVGGKCFLYVQSDSMNAKKPESVAADKPSGFSKGTMIIGKYIADDDAAVDGLSVGDIITYEWDINGDGTISPGENNTHRITEIERDASGAIISVSTMGDNPEYSNGMSETVRRSAIIAVYTGGKVPGLGAVLSFLNTQLGFGLCILLPLAAFFIYQLIKFIRAVTAVKNEGKKVISAADEELIKQKAIEEYLRRQKEAENSPSDTAESAEGQPDEGKND